VWEGAVVVAGAPLAEADPGPGDDPDVVDLVPMLRRVVGARVKDPHTVEDLVQETLARVMAASPRPAPEKLAPYAAVTARNLVATMAERNDRARDRSHLLAETDEPEPPGQRLLRQESRSSVLQALANLPVADRDLLLAHEIDGQDTLTLAADRGSTPGAVAARLNRARASLRVEFLLAEERLEPPTDRCRPVLRALSLGDRRRQRELDVDHHVLGCPVCTRVRTRLHERRPEQLAQGAVRVPVTRDADVVTARQKGREVAAGLGFSASDLTLVATAISEVARNIVKFAEHGEVVVTPMTEPERRGVHVVVRDVGPGIEDAARAMEDGYSTYHGLGLGLPGARRLMDHFDLVSTPGEGTTVTMEKWLR
jgi:serine/threonine-protein kinase RsbT